MKRIISFLLLISTLFLCLASCGNFANNEKYKEGLDLINEGKYEEAYAFFLSMGDDEGAKEYLSRFHYVVTSMKLYEGELAGEPVETWTMKLGKNNLPKQYLLSLGNETAEVNYTYDYKGNLLKIIEKVPDGDYSEYYDYTYDENDNLIKEIRAFSNGDYKIYEYTYNTNNQMILQDTINSNGEKQTKVITYDANGNIIKQIEENSYGKTIIEYIYDDNNNITKHTYTTDGVKYVAEYTYDSKGNLIQKQETETFYENTEITNYIYTYDENGNKIEEVCTKSNGYSSTTKYSYDASGNLMQETHIDSSGNEKTTKYTYDYDAYGNPTKIVESNSYRIETIEVEWAFIYIPIDFTQEEFDEIFVLNQLSFGS